MEACGGCVLLWLISCPNLPKKKKKKKKKNVLFLVIICCTYSDMC